MGDLLRRSPLTVALMALAVVLAAIVGLEYALGGPKGVGAPGRRVVPAEAKLLPALAQVPPEQAYPETAARPLFIPTRRPAPEAVVAQQPTFQRGQYSLVGVIMAGGTRTAMLREKSNGRMLRAPVGGELSNGVKVTQIDRDTVVLALGAETETVGMVVAKTPTPGQPGAAAPMAGPGPFGASAPAGAAPVARPQPIPNMGGPVPAPPGTSGPAQFPANAPSPGALPMPSGAPGGPPLPNASNPAVPDVALTPEEILARRRQRRAQQNQ